MGSAALEPRASRRSLSPSRRVAASAPPTALMWWRLGNIVFAVFSVAVHTVLLLIGIATSTTLAELPRTTTSATGLVSAGGWPHGWAGTGWLMVVISSVVRQRG